MVNMIDALCHEHNYPRKSEGASFLLLAGKEAHSRLNTKELFYSENTKMCIMTACQQ